MQELPPAEGPYDAKYLAFLGTIESLRPRLHRFCTRMTGSALDGEDVVQETLFQAYRKLDTYDESRPLAAWLFRIAHNRAIDFIRRRQARESAEARAPGDTTTPPVEPAGREVNRALARLVLGLPPKERAAIVLKDVLGYSLEEIADLIDSTEGGVKAALKRARTKMAEPGDRPAPARPVDEQDSRVLRLYVDRFNRKDWEGVRELTSADARLQVVDRWAGRLADSPYFSRYGSRPSAWHMALAEVDGERVLVQLLRKDDAWVPASAIRIDVEGDLVVRVHDYGHCPWVLAEAGAVALLDAPPAYPESGGGA